MSGNAESTPSTSPPMSAGCWYEGLVVILAPEMRDELLAFEEPQRVFQLHQLDEEIMFGVEPRRVDRALEVEGQPLLDARHPGALGEIEKQRDVEDDRRGKDAVAAQEVDLELHRITEPAHDI